MVLFGDTVTTVGTIIVTVADADFVWSALDVAVTVTFAGLGIAFGAVYNPPAVIAPHPVPKQPAPCTVQVTLDVLVPVTVAVNCCCSPVPTRAVCGETLTTTGGRMVTAADADLVWSAVEVAVTFI
jgi:hypothetical protein